VVLRVASGSGTGGLPAGASDNRRACGSPGNRVERGRRARIGRRATWQVPLGRPRASMCSVREGRA